MDVKLLHTEIHISGAVLTVPPWCVVPYASRSASRAKFQGKRLPLLLFLYAWVVQVKRQTVHWMLSNSAAHFRLDSHKEQRLAEQQNSTNVIC